MRAATRSGIRYATLRYCRSRQVWALTGITTTIMFDIDMTDTKLETIPTKPDREPRISKKMRQALRLLSTGECKTQRAACARAGLSERHFSRFLQRAEIQAFLAREARKTIALGVGRAANRLVELVDGPSAHVAADVSKHILAIDGIRPPENGTNINITNMLAGYIIDLRSDSEIEAAERGAPPIVGDRPMPLRVDLGPKQPTTIESQPTARSKP